MAKKASAPAPAKSTTAKAAPKGANGKPTSKPSKPAKPGTPAMTSELIGLAAGEVWQTLADKGPLPLAGLKKSVDLPADFIFAALGWLAREEKLEFASSGKTMMVGLR